MGDTKELFLRQTELCEQLDAVIKSDWFKKCLAFACSELMERPGVTSEHLAGVQRFKTVLLSMTDDDDDESVALPSSGLIHNLDIPSRDVPAQPKPKRKKKV